MHIAIIQRTESQEALDVALAVERAGMIPRAFLFNSSTLLAEFVGFILLDGDQDILSQLRCESKKGKPILGVDRGAHFVCAAGLVPGLENDAVGIEIVEDSQANQRDAVNIRLLHGYQWNAFTRHLSSKDTFSMPEQGKGRFVIPQGLLLEMKHNGQCLFGYEGGTIAALSNKAGNVMAMLPHPEQTACGEAIFKSMRDYITEGCYQDVAPMYYQPRKF